MSNINLQMYTIKDEKSCIYNTPFYADNVTDAVRTFTVTAENPKSAINKWPQEFSLYFVGTYNQQTGIVSQPKLPEHICSAVSVLAKTEVPK